MQIKIGQIYKIKPEFRCDLSASCDVCVISKNYPDAKYLESLSCNDFKILNEKKQVIGLTFCDVNEHLEPIEKTLYNLEIGDEIEEKNGNQVKVLGLIESSSENPLYVLSDFLNEVFCKGIYSAKELEYIGYRIVQPEQERYPENEMFEVITKEEAEDTINKLRICKKVFRITKGIQGRKKTCSPNCHYELVKQISRKRKGYKSKN